MSSPRMICKSGYIKNPLHLINVLEYSGNKIASQQIVYNDGSLREVKADTIITLTPAEQKQVLGIRLNYKDGGSKTISYETYCKHTRESQQSIRVRELNTIGDESKFLVSAKGKQYRELEDLDLFAYLEYIEGRPGAEKEENHGLFGISGDGCAGNIAIDAARAMAEQHPESTAWAHILSLDREAAIAAGFDCREAWKDLLIAKAPEIARIYNISLENLVLNAAFHSNTDNPHSHLIVYSKDSHEGFVAGGKPAMQHASEKLKSLLYNEIFKESLLATKQQKSELRNELKVEFQARLERCMAKEYTNPELEQKLLALAGNLGGLHGKKQYGYLPAALKLEVDGILRGMVESDVDLKALFDGYCNSHRELVSGYVANPQTVSKKMEDFKASFFHPQRGNLCMYHNAIVACAHELTTAPERFARAVEEEIPDFVTQEAPMSSAEYESYFNSSSELPEQDEVPWSALRAAEEEIPDFATQEAPMSSMEYESYFNSSSELPEQDEVPWSALRASEEEIPDFATQEAPMSSMEYESYFSSSSELPEPDEVPWSTLRAVEEEIPDAITSEYGASRSFLFNSQPMQSHAESKADAFSQTLQNTIAQLTAPQQNISKKINCVYRKAFSGLFDPRRIRTALQEHALAHLEAIYHMKQGDITPHVSEIIRLIYYTDQDFRSDMDELIAKVSVAVDESNAPAVAKTIRQDMLDGGLQFSGMTSYAVYFSKTLMDQKYYQLMEAYPEYQKPLNREAMNTMREWYCGDSREKLIHNLQEIKFYRKFSEEHPSESRMADKIVREHVQTMFSALLEYPDFADAFDEYRAHFGDVFRANFDEDDAKRYNKRFHDTLLRVPRLMRAHLTIVQAAEHLDQFVYRETIRNKDLYKPFYKALFDALGSALSGELPVEEKPSAQESKVLHAQPLSTRNNLSGEHPVENHSQAETKRSFLAEYIRQELHAMKDDENPEHAVHILKLLYESDSKVKYAVGNMKTSVFLALEQELGTDSALNLAEQFEASLFTADSGASVHFAMKGYANNLIENYLYQFLFEFRGDFEAVTKHVENQLHEKLIDSEVSRLLQEQHQRLLAKEPDSLEIEKGAAAVLRSLYGKQLDSLIDTAMGRMCERFRRSCDDSNLNLEFTERLRTAIYGGEACCGHNYFINRIAEQLPNEQAKLVLTEMKKELKEYRSRLFRALRTAVIQGIPEMMRATEFTPETMDVLLKAVSNKNLDFVSGKQRLKREFLTRWEAHGFAPDRENAGKIFDDFFYGTGSRYDTLYIKEFAEKTRAAATEIRAEYQAWLRDQLLHSIGRGLMRTIAVMMHNQNMHASQAAEQARRKKAFASRRQFKNSRQLSQSAQFEQDNTMSY